jgi:hypothetical protein
VSGKVAALAIFGISLWCSQSSAQSSDEWSLEPLSKPFPCDTAHLTATGFLFVKPLKITSNGRVFLSPIAGSSYPISYACERATGILLLDQSAMQNHPNNLLEVIKRDCSH